MRGEEEVKSAGAARYGKRMQVLIMKKWQPEALSQACGERSGRGVCVGQGQRRAQKRRRWVFTASRQNQARRI